MQDNLTDTKVRNAKAADKPYKLTDGRGMYLLVTPKGQKWWRLDYRLHGKRKTLSLGVYPDVKLKKARGRRQQARDTIAEGVDPSQVRKEEKIASKGGDNFKAVAVEWLSKHKPGWAEKHWEKIEGRLKNDVYPYVGKTPIETITAQDILKVLRRN